MPTTFVGNVNATKGTVLSPTLKPPTNIDKAALLLKRLAPPSLIKILEIIGPEHAKRLNAVMADISKRPDFAVLSEQVLQEFRELQQEVRDSVGNSPLLTRMQAGVSAVAALSNSPPATNEQSASADDASTAPAPVAIVHFENPLQELQATPVAIMSIVLQREPPSVMALVLKQLTPEVTSRVMELLPPEVRQQTFLLLTGTKQVNPVVVQGILKTIAQACRAVDPAAAEQGDTRSQDLVNLLQKFEREERLRLIDVLNESDPELAKQIDDLLYDFTDLLRIEDRSVQKILSQLEQRTVALAIKTAPEDLMQKVMKNLSERVRGMLAEEMELLGVVPNAKADPARREIADAIRTQDKEGTLVWLEEA